MAGAFGAKLKALVDEADAAIAVLEAKCAALEAQLAERVQAANVEAAKAIEGRDKALRHLAWIRAQSRSHVDALQGVLAKEPEA